MPNRKSLRDDTPIVDPVLPKDQSQLQSRSVFYSTIGVIIIAAVMVLNTLVQLDDLRTVHEYQTLSVKTMQAVEELDSILVAMLDMETGVRGFMITGREEYLEPYNNSRGQALLHLNKFRELPKGAPGLQAQITTIEDSIVAAVSFYTQAIQIARTNGIEAGRKELAKVEAGKLSLFLEQVDLKSVLTTMDQTFRQLAEEKGLSFICQVSEGAPYQITTDSQRLEQILKNFLSNAIKFTDRGSVELSLASAKDVTLPNGKPAVLVFKVKDTGIGIPKEKQDLIFEAFQQADGSTSREYGGTGLGLTISRELSGKLGGKIVMESESRKGSTFSLYLPLSIEAESVRAHLDVSRAADLLADGMTLERIQV